MPPRACNPTNSLEKERDIYRNTAQRLESKPSVSFHVRM